MNELQSGVIDDPRPDVLKEQDYKHSDIYGGEVEWKKKDISELKSLTPRNQDGSLSCCAQAGAKAVETLIAKIMSAHPPYRSRSNFPSGGMYTQNIGEVFKNPGTNLEEVDKSQNQGESLLNRDITCETPYKIKGYLFPNPSKIDEIAQAIETWGHCILVFHANKKEWTARPEYNAGFPDFGHAICAVDYFLDEDGEKCLWIEDSAGISTTIDFQHRIINEEYLKLRCDGAIYFIGVNPFEIPYVFKEFLKYGYRGFAVKKLQAKLNELGYILTVDGIFGRMTREAVINFQEKHQLVPDGLVGKLTNAELNK